MQGPTFLHIRGTLAENMVYTPRPGYESSDPGRREEGDQAFRLVLRDRGERELVSIAPQVIARCGQADRPLRFRVRGALPFHRNAASYELRKGESLLYRAEIATEPPTVTSPRVRRTTGKLNLHWETPIREDITYSIAVRMESGRRFTIARRIKGSSYAVDIGALPVPGKATVLILAHDGVRSSEVGAASIDVPERPHTVHIVAPAPDARLPFGQPLSVLGCYLDMAGQPCSPESAVWALDGERFATDSMVAALDRVPSGNHTLNLSCGSENNRIEASINFHVDEPDDDHRRWEELVRLHEVRGV